MEEVIQRKNEKNKDYLLRVALAFLEQYEDTGELNMVKYHGAICDWSCLKDDIEIEIR